MDIFDKILTFLLLSFGAICYAFLITLAIYLTKIAYNPLTWMPAIFAWFAVFVVSLVIIREIIWENI